ncbi:chromosome segregation protein SMC [Proteiniclasticum sp.]|uniref:chromosome segregation protein SMC n=1 Tax=Proteiniclasticum sp. TaxID=2053595 RepID=UPI00289FD60F|nr:chromosome segregation protein SMC [Proteiniclasticum sp.]
MYLKSIEIRGFKSFADRTLLNFNNGITGVVGPNGSGKSNISDAVRWVLGEQKVKSLRGGKMEDVIFSGTDFRKPLGYAEVTLLLDNSEKKLPVPYTDVSVTRKLFRSGESEYLINNTSCRLRDIQELFMDTGIGKEGYSLIGQGKIEAILSGKMDDRRALLEEAAGIVKYKSRKEESEKKLNNTEQNLLRVNDILKTYEERIGPLKREKEKAEKFLVLSKEQREILISLILSDLEEFENEKLSLDEKLNRVSENYHEVERRRAEATASRDELELSMEEKKRKETELKEAFYVKREQSEAALTEIRMLYQLIEERKKSLLKNEKSLELTTARHIEEEQNLSALAEEILKGTDRISEVTEFLEEKRRRQEELQESLKLSENAQKGLRDEEEDTEQKIRNIREQSKSSYSDRDTLKGRIDNTESMVSSYKASLSMNEMAKTATEEEIKALKDKISDEDRSLTMRKENSKEVLNRLSVVDSAIKDIDYELRGQESQMKLLRNLEEHYEGYTRSVKSLMTHLKEARHKLNEKVHLVGEVIKPQKGFELALEVALGSQVNNIITPTDKDAKELIDLLRAKSYGRATFYPMNVIKGYKAKDPMLKRGNLLGNLLDLVNFEQKYEGIAANLLGRIFVAKNMDEALISAKEMGYTMRIVTLEGDIINSGGSLTGGSLYKKSSGIFSRKKDLDDLDKNSAVLREKRLHEVRKKQEIEKELQEKTREERESSYLINTLNMELAKLSERQQGFQKDMDRLQKIILDTERDLSSRRTELESLDKMIEDMEHKISELIDQKEKNKDYLKGIKDRRTREYQEFDQLTAFIMDESVKEGRLLEAHDAKKQSMERTKASLSGLVLSISELEQEREILSGEINESQAKIEEMKETVLMLKDGLSTMEKELDLMSMDEVKDKASLKEQVNTVRTLDEEFYVLDKELYKVKDAAEKLEKEKTVLLNKINDELNLTLAEAKEERIPIPDKDAFRKRLNELRRMITSLGVVNVAAIEEFKEVSEHSEFLSVQRDDLEKAKLELKELILDMTLRMRTLFTENFKVMNENFNDTFRRLFQGGTARLILGEGDILEAPIEISVQPPGKKLQNITLMSGGEKVLSAIALTFAILRMKPTPFCILDEIEAALDDANVYRFAEFLTEFARDTQFILITHRKGTMEAADALYGVTMEEKGISKIVSMDLSVARRENG